jgi:hypothetical protein
LAALVFLIMARQAGTYHITGCYQNLCFYSMDGNYYVRVKSSLTAKRVKRDPAFKRTMAYAGLLGCASTIASALYKLLPKESKGITVYRKLTGRVMRLLQDGRSSDEIFYLLAKPHVVQRKRPGITREKKRGVGDDLYADALIASVFSDTTVTERAIILQIEGASP